MKCYLLARWDAIGASFNDSQFVEVLAIQAIY